MTHRLFKFYFFLFILPYQFLYSQKETQLKITGNKIFTEKEYISWIAPSFNHITVSNVDSLVTDLINKNLLQEGYFNYKINSIWLDTTNIRTNTIHLSISEGENTKIREIKFFEESSKDSLVDSDYFDSLIGDSFTKNRLEQSIESALLFFENNGYPFAKINIQSIHFNKDSNTVDINLIIFKNNLSTIDKVKIIGNDKTKDDVIINSLRITKGELYSQKKIENIPIILNRLRYFDLVKTPMYYINSQDEGVLEISVSEKSTNNFDGILGYVPAAQNESSGYFTGFVNINLRNIFGTGREATIRWEQLSNFTQELELKYLEPWLFNYPFNFNISYFQRKQDSTYVQRKIGGLFEYLATENISASIILENESIIPSIDRKVAVNIFNSNSIYSGLQLKLDYRDDLYSPKSGIYFSSIYKYKSKNIRNNTMINITPNKSKFNYNNYELDFGIYYHIFKNQVLALGIHAKEIIGDFFEISDYYKLGGTNSLRGYRENQFLGNRILWTNLEWRSLLSLSSYIFAFLDYGYFLIDKDENRNILKNSDYLYGFGLGLSLNTALGIMRVSYALGEGKSFSEGLIHFGILNDF